MELLSVCLRGEICMNSQKPALVLILFLVADLKAFASTVLYILTIRWDVTHSLYHHFVVLFHSLEQCRNFIQARDPGATASRISTAKLHSDCHRNSLKALASLILRKQWTNALSILFPAGKILASVYLCRWSTKCLEDNSCASLDIREVVVSFLTTQKMRRIGLVRILTTSHSNHMFCSIESILSLTELARTRIT